MAATQRFLVKVAPGNGSSFALNGVAVPVRTQPLFTSIGGASVSAGGKAALALGNLSSWHIVEPALPIANTPNPWDVCHQMVTQGMGVAPGQAVVFAEPDLPQSWQAESQDDSLQALGEACVASPQDPDFPTIAGNDWYRDSKHGQYAGLPKDATGAGVRIAHLDTGYDPQHASKPLKLEAALGRNFVDSGKPNDATDETSGLWNNRGHGTGTLSILAGAPTAKGFPGVAPGASVVPMRVANRVVLFYNSAIAQAFDEVHKLCQKPETFVDVVTMSMGGLASQAWAEAVNALYEAGVFVVTAAGNNYDNKPTRNIVFPARFNRVVAACGAMANEQPYANLGAGKMAGNYGPESKMRTAMAAYTPNIPWARFGCSDIYRFDGAGTSSATPQVAATAALYIQANRMALKKLSEPWMRVEAVRRALFASAAKVNPTAFGNGVIRAVDALSQKVPAASQLKKEAEDYASFGLLRALTGLGVAGQPSSVEAMLELEALQLSQSSEIEALMPDPSAADQLPQDRKLAVLRALANHPRASQALRTALQASPAGTSPSASSQPSVTLDAGPFPAAVRMAPIPAVRRLRVYTYDPSLGQSVDTFTLNETVAAVRWEEGLQPGPIGEYLEVVDVDPASGRCYAPVDLNDPHLLATDGLAPSEANPQFHQQMVYAVAMRTIEHFERALGRKALWAPHFDRTIAPGGLRTVTQSRYVQRLRIYPHALRARNAYYSPEKKALLLGYFTGSSTGEEGDQHAVFTALSSDIVAHETSHALLDGLHRRFREPTNDDVLAFHEAFADIVALFQHFSLEGALRDALREQIATRRGDLSQDNLLTGIALQFGRETGEHRALRSAVGKPASTKDYKASTEPHARGSVLVAAVFDAFLQIYKRRSVQPIRLATAGSEVLAPGALQADLVDALAEVASSVARHVLLMCIRALDYCPPVDITFGDFLRAVITADKDLVPSDPHGYRVAFSSAFRARGIYPESVRTVSVDTLCWEPPPAPLKGLSRILGKMSLSWDLQADRFKAWASSRENGFQFHQWLTDPAEVSDDELAMLGLHRKADPNYQVKMPDGTVVEMDLRGIEVHSVRPLQRIGPDGELLSQLVVELTQAIRSKEDDKFVIRGGCTLIVDLSKAMVTYMVRKRAEQVARFERQQQMRADYEPSLRDIYSGASGWGDEPFAFLHGVH